MGKYEIILRKEKVIAFFKSCNAAADPMSYMPTSCLCTAHKLLVHVVLCRLAPIIEAVITLASITQAPRCGATVCRIHLHLDASWRFMGTPTQNGVVTVGNNETTLLGPDSLLGEFTKAIESRINFHHSRTRWLPPESKMHPGP